MDSYMDKTIIAWLTYKKDYYGDANKVCYIYPRYIKQPGGVYEPLKDGDERIDVRITQDGVLADRVVEEHGPLVNVKFNLEPARRYEDDRYLSIRYNPAFMDSEIEISRFKEKGLMQIFETSKEFTAITKDRFIISDIQLYTNEVLIRTGGVYYGPFDAEYETQERKISLLGKKEYRYTIKSYEAAAITRLIGITIADEEGMRPLAFIPKDSVATLQATNNDIDWISDDTLMDGLSAALKVASTGAYGYTKSQIRHIKNVITESVQLSADMELSEARMERLMGMLDKVIRHEEIKQTLMVSILDDKAAFDQLVTVFCEEYIDIIEEKSRDFIQVRERKARLQAEVEAQEQRLAELKSDESVLTKEAQARHHEIMQKLENEEKNLKVTLEQLQTEHQQLQQYVGIARDISELSKKKEVLNKEITHIQVEYDQYKQEQARLETQLNTTLEHFKDQVHLIARVIDSKLLTQVLQAVSEEKPEVEVLVPFNTRLLFNPRSKLEVSGERIIRRVYEYLQGANRDLSPNDTANYLICIMQGFITTFAGEPGTGKTSLCTILAKSLGLARSDAHSRFVDISVERGWTSHKDFIGYYNPLTKMMEKSNNRVFDALERLHYEHEHGANAPFFMLLDEANLSPLEHYWAAFLRLCDEDSAYSRSLSLGGKHHWNIPKYLRFLATVNFDHTTEELSPRFLDRSWIITLDPNTAGGELVHLETPNQETIISYSALSTAFLPRGDGGIGDEGISNKWSKIQSIFRLNNLPIMPRNQKMVHTYCAIACKYMDTQTQENRFAPLDYAVSQKILPIINGTGERYQNLLKGLKEECKSMPLCRNHIARILKAADENMGFYQFFAK
ncbi:MAG: AAA family ATPase [Treponema sp.]|nr:AAA family ATPase [Treponema sp.]